MQAGGHFSLFITKNSLFPKENHSKAIQKFVKVRKSVKIRVNKSEVVVFGVTELVTVFRAMQLVTLL